MDAREFLNRKPHKVVMVWFVMAELFLMFFMVKCSPLDSFSGTVFIMIFGEDTTYADGYSDDKFLQLKAGMTKEEVRRLMGEPLLRSEVEKGTFDFPHKKGPPLLDVYLEQTRESL